MSERGTQLPPGWSYCRIDDVVAHDGVFTDGDWVESKDQDPNGEVRLIQLADIGDRTFNDKSARFLTKVKAAELNCTFLEEGDLLIARMPEPLGRCCIFPLAEKEQYVTVVDVCAVRLGASEVDSKYMMYLINSPQMRADIEALKSGSTRKRISRKNLGTIQAPLAPGGEQQRIVAKIEELFSELDKGVESLRTAKEQLNVYRQVVLDSAASGWLLVHRNHSSKPFGDDDIVPLETVVDELGQGWSPRCLNHPSPENDVWGVIKTTAIQHLYFDESENKELPNRLEPRPHLSINAGDILVTRAGPRKRVGVACLVRSCRPRLMLCDKAYRLQPNPEKVLPEYLEMLLNSPHVLDEVEKLKTGISDSGVNLTQTRFLSMRLTVPSIEKQTATLAELGSILSNIDSVEAQIEMALERNSSLRQSILRKAFSGQLVEQNPDDEPASVLLGRIKSEKERQTKDKKKTKKRKSRKDAA